MTPLAYLVGWRNLEHVLAMLHSGNKLGDINRFSRILLQLTKECFFAFTGNVNVIYGNAYLSYEKPEVRHSHGMM